MKYACLLIAGLLMAADARGQALLHDATEDTTTTTPPPVAAPPPPAAAPTVFRAGIDLVALNVVVTDGHAKFVSGLKQQDFSIYEDGVPQDVSFFAASSVPLDLAILLDTSASMSDKIREVQQAAGGFVSTLREGDRAMIVEIKDSTRILQPLTGDVAAAKAAIASTSARGGTALMNGIYLTLKELTKQRRDSDEIRRQAIVVLSDGDDTASLVTFDDLLAEAKDAGIAIYTISLRSESVVQMAIASGRRYVPDSGYSMRALAQETGARAFFPETIGALSGIYGSIAEELATQYAVGYVPKNSKRDGSYRHVTVRIADRPGVSPRTRSGYTAPRADRKASAH